MQDRFESVLEAHAARYPAMMPQDYGKLAYQHVFGPEHLVEDAQAVDRLLQEEWETLRPDPDGVFRAEPVGNGLCRLHLAGPWDPAAGKLLGELFCRTAREHSGTAAELAERLDLLQSCPVPGMRDWLADYRAAGCPAVHHSEPFRKAYHPHYRVLAADYAHYFPALLALYRQLAEKGRIVVAVDGRCGSDKSGFGRLLERLFACNVVHMDDFYLPIAARPENWTEIPGGNMDLSRFREEVLLPARRGETIFYRPFDCRSQTLLDAKLLPSRPLTVVEGSYSHHPELAGGYDLKLFLTCSREEQARRLQAREGTYYQTFETCWIPAEERYLRSFDIENADVLRLDTTAFFME